MSPRGCNMSKCVRAIVAVMLLNGAGCCHECGSCCDWGGWWRDRSLYQNNQVQPANVPVQAAPVQPALPPPVSRTPIGAYGGTGQ